MKIDFVVRDKKGNIVSEGKYSAEWYQRIVNFQNRFKGMLSQFWEIKNPEKYDVKTDENGEVISISYKETTKKK